MGYHRLDSKRTGLIMDLIILNKYLMKRLAQNIQEVYISFLNVPQNLYKCTLPQPKTKIELYMVAQLLIKCLKDTLRDYRIFAEKSSLRKESFHNDILKFGEMP